MKRLGRIAVLSAVILVSSAHIGSPDTYFEGPAGPYRVRVIVRSPGVVPGLAQISVRLLDAARAGTVTVLPVYWDPRIAAPPPPDTAQVVSGDSTLFGAALWLMSRGPYSVHVTVAGDAGSGTAIVPVVAVATRRLGLDLPLAVGLAAFGAFLFVGAVTIVGAAVREAVLPPGEVPDARRLRRARWAAGAGGAVVALALFGGRGWWNDVDREFGRSLYQPLASDATLRVERGRQVLRFSILDSLFRAGRRAPLVPDHGHLVHVFVVGDQAFAHLHPALVDSSNFDSALPPLPAGRYRVYTDITRESGFSETLADTVLVAEAGQQAWQPTDRDDAWTNGTGDGGQGPGQAVTLSDGSRMTWERGAGGGPLVADQDAPLRFTVTAPDGRPAALEPYMGMAGHLMLSRDDGTVFVHLHPLGTISWAAQQTFLLRGPADTVRGAVGRRLTEREASISSMSPMNHPATAEVSFPYAFPKPGRYRLWVQVRRQHNILTGVFDAEVQ